MSPGSVIYLLWIAWVITWVAAAGWSNRTERRVGFESEFAYHALTLVGMVLFMLPAHGYEGRLRLWHVGVPGAWLFAALVSLGFAFTWWARIHLGRLWSGTITRKTDHHVVDSGPYAVVRHPIYTGLLLAVLATAAAKGTVTGVAGASFIVIGLWMKAHLEERWLSAELGEESYAAYRRRVPMLVPFGPKGPKAHQRPAPLPRFTNIFP